MTSTFTKHSETIETLEDQTNIVDLIEDPSIHSLLIKPTTSFHPASFKNDSNNTHESIIRNHQNALGLLGSPTNTLEYSPSEEPSGKLAAMSAPSNSLAPRTMRRYSLQDMQKHLKPSKSPFSMPRGVPVPLHSERRETGCGCSSCIMF